MKGYLNTAIKSECYGCEACANACPVGAIIMVEDEERFRYPVVDNDKCIHCNLCHKVCPYENKPLSFSDNKTAFGGRTKDVDVLAASTSGGAFSAIVEGWCDANYVIFGAASDGIRVYHDHIEDKSELAKFRRSKYSQSNVGTAFSDAKKCLKEGKKVLFSGTPCQIAGLMNCVGDVNTDNLLTVEVVCEGVPSPLYIDRFNEYIRDKYKSDIQKIDYRYKDMKSISPIKGKWDFQVMHLTLQDGRTIKKDRWFNPFWSIWLKHIMSRPSCYECAFANQSRTADISLGDLWGVHLYCQDLYSKNAGASLIVCNTEKGKEALELAKPHMIGRDLKFEDALRYQAPMRKHIDGNARREEFMQDVTHMEYKSLCKKWATPPSIKLLWQKYIWGNRQKVWLWNLTHKESK